MAEKLLAALAVELRKVTELRTATLPAAMESMTTLEEGVPADPAICWMKLARKIWSKVEASWKAAMSIDAKVIVEETVVTAEAAEGGAFRTEVAAALACVVVKGGGDELDGGRGTESVGGMSGGGGGGSRPGGDGLRRGGGLGGFNGGGLGGDGGGELGGDGGGGEGGGEGELITPGKIGGGDGDGDWG